MQLTRSYTQATTWRVRWALLPVRLKNESWVWACRYLVRQPLGGHALMSERLLLNWKTKPLKGTRQGYNELKAWESSMGVVSLNT